MAITIKAVLRTDKKANSDGEHQLMIRTTYQRKIKYPYTFPFRLSEKDWNKKSEKVKPSHRKSKKLNDLIFSVRDEIEDFCYEELTKNPNISPDELNKRLNARGETQDFLKVAEKIIERQSRENTISTTWNKKYALRKLAKFCNGSLEMESFNRLLLQEFIEFCLEEEEMAKSTVNQYLSTLKLLHDEMVLDQVAKPDPYLFKRIYLDVKWGKKDVLTIDELKALRDADILGENPTKWEKNRDDARNIFMFMFFAAGMRVSDAILLKWNNIKDGSIAYTMVKIRKHNHSEIRIPLTDGAKKIIDKYRTKVIDPNEFIFPFAKGRDFSTEESRHRSLLKSKNRVLYYIEKVCDDLLDKKVTPHMARHTFSAVFEEQSHGDVDTLQSLLNHANRQTTEIYRTKTFHKEQSGMEAFNESMKKALGE